MKSTIPSPKLDLTVGNVADWRKQSLRKWTPQQTKVWTVMRDSAVGKKRAAAAPGLFELIARSNEKFFLSLVAIGGALMLFVAYQVLTAFFSGRVQEVLDQIIRSH